MSTPNSPFNRSGLTPRSPQAPPPPRDQEDVPPEPDQPQVFATSDLQNWLSGIERFLTEICSTATEGKLNSDQKLKIHTLCRKIGHGTSQMVVQYQSVKQKFLSAQMSLQTMSEKRELAHHLELLTSAVFDNKQQNTETLSYASMTKKGTQHLIRPSKLSTVAIFPEDKKKTSEETRALVQTIINPEELKLQVRGVWNTKNGGVIISSENKEDIKKLKSSEKLTSSGLTVAEQDKRKPKMIVFGLPKDLEEKEFFDHLFVQNIAPKLSDLSRDQFIRCVRLSHKSGKKEAQTCNFILEIPANIRNVLKNQERVFINWSSFPIRDFTHVSRCFKCHQYGHSAKFCRDRNPTCGHCGQIGHEMRDCSKREVAPVCATCLRYKKPSNHRTGDEHCPARKHAVSRYIESTDYVGA